MRLGDDALKIVSIPSPKVDYYARVSGQVEILITNDGLPQVTKADKVLSMDSLVSLLRRATQCRNAMQASAIVPK